MDTQDTHEGHGLIAALFLSLALWVAALFVWAVLGVVV